jgi:hypothetical protein
MLKNYIEKLKAKPEEKKNQIAFLSALVITLIIIVFWYAGVTGLSKKMSDNLVSGVVESAGAPIDSLVASIGNVFTDLKDLIWKPKKIEINF